MSAPDHRAMQRYIRESPEVRLWAINLVRTGMRIPYRHGSIVPTWPAAPEPVEACTSVLVHGAGLLAIRYPCTLSVPHDGRLHEHRPRPGRMAVAEWA